MKTRQEIFDKAYIGLVKQGCKSGDSNGCHYTLHTGDAVLHCAVGHLFEEGTDTDEFNSISVKCAEEPLTGKAEALSLALLEAGVNIKADLCLLRELQMTHDTCTHDNFVAQFKSRAAFVAKNFNLTIPEVTE